MSPKRVFFFQSFAGLNFTISSHAHSLQENRYEADIHSAQSEYDGGVRRFHRAEQNIQEVVGLHLAAEEASTLIGRGLDQSS